MKNASYSSTLPALLKGEGLPNFQEITPQDVEVQIPKLLIELNTSLSELEEKWERKLSSQEQLCWEEVMDPLYQIEERLRWSWGLVSHLNAVCNSAELRQAHASQQAEVVRFKNRIGQSQPLYKALNYLKDQKIHLLNKTKKRILESELMSMRHRGIGLHGSELEAFNTTSERLANLATTFSNNVLDASQEWSLLITNPSEVQGLPHSVLQTMAAAAKEAGDSGKEGEGNPTAEEGPWRLGLDMPRYIPFMTHAKSNNLRERLYKAQVSKASSGSVNNQPLIEEILLLRTQQAHSLGYANWADLSLSNKMAKDVEAVELLLEELRSAAFPAAQKEIDELRDFAKKHGSANDSDLSAWSLSYWSEQLRQQRFELNQEALRPWFPLPQVLDGLFQLCQRLFNIYIEVADGQVSVWHPDVRFFKVFDQDGSHIASFYLDPYSRPGTKRGGAWMDECLVKRKASNGDNVLPVAYLVCNQTPPIDKKPSLMSFEEVKTLFHEFGHGLQHMLTKVDLPQAAGINNIEWDAVELPSQFMENWCLDRATLMGIARHWESGEPLPEEEFKKLQLSHTFNAGISTLRQIHFALTDIRLHSEWNKKVGISPDELRRQVALTTSIIPPIDEDKFLCSFSHIFAGGYSAGYYSYKWAEVLSADAFAAFEEVGLNKEVQLKTTGGLFRETVLGMGGSESPEEVFKAFRGRPPETKFLIRHCGLKAI